MNAQAKLPNKNPNLLDAPTPSAVACKAEDIMHRARAMQWAWLHLLNDTAGETAENASEMDHISCIFFETICRDAAKLFEQAHQCRIDPRFREAP